MTGTRQERIDQARENLTEQQRQANLNSVFAPGLAADEDDELFAHLSTT